MISFIMPAKNAGAYIQEAINSLQKETQVSWELIVVDDHSIDGTLEIVQKLCELDSRIKIFKNAGAGKVQGLNYGFSLSTGDVIKCIDADDVLLPEFFSHIDELNRYDAHCHDSFVVDEQMKELGSYFINRLVITEDYHSVVKYLISIPRWGWSMKRHIAEKVFPMPDHLPFEDVWFSLIIKRYAREIYHIKEKLYLYRQHPNQTFGGVLNYDKAIINFRANRMLVLIERLKQNIDTLGLENGEIFRYSQEYNKLLKSDFSLLGIIKSNLKHVHKLKLILICFFPQIASIITRVKWKMDSFAN
ncbi:MAG: glycosyltransferase family 2 protein [Imperialibacter sp.]|uniref:glycosyltransferase family 2 protein n=1 Tax=Imperialibacter sp. TaxID=2038411 RepID=UPI0032EDEE4D